MKKNKIRIYLLVIGILVLSLIVYGIVLLNQSKKITLLDSSKGLIYTTYENKDYNQKVPAINTTFLTDDINNSIIEFTNKYLNKKEAHINYHYQVNGNILSLLIVVEDYHLEGAPDVTFKSYIIDLKKEKLLSKEEVLKLFNVSEQYLVNSIDKQFKKYYEDEKNKGIISNMTYQEYMSKRGLTDIANSIYLDIKDSKLNIYLDYDAFLSEEKEYYFSEVGYVFEVNVR